MICFLTSLRASGQSSVGPARGSLIIQGGGDILPEIWERFIALSGGPDANFVFIPSADEPVDPLQPAQDEFPTKRFKHVTVLHIGTGRVTITDGNEHDGRRYYYLKVGDRFDLKTRTKLDN